MNSGNRLRLKNGQVVTVMNVNGGNLFCISAEGTSRYVSHDQICHVLGTACEACEPKKDVESEERIENGSE